MRHEKKKKRSKAGLTGIQRRGARIESLESRQMMFGADALGAAIGPELPLGPGIDTGIDLDLPGVFRPADCIDFEDMPASGNYVVGDIFIADNTGLQAKFTGEPFTWGGGGVTAGGYTSVEHANHAGHLGQDMMVNNILVDIDFGATVSGVTLQFGEYGGNLNLEINGDFRNFGNFRDVDGLNIGGVNVSIGGGGYGNDVGQLVLNGSINSLKLGGQELWIDHVCTTEDYRFDWGDAPDQPYPTLAANGGAHHLIDPDVFLGSSVEGEADGQPTFASDGDDLNVGANIDDEDGVRFLTPLVPGNMATVEVVASTRGWLNSWIDFDRNGSWDSGTAEQIFAAEPLNPGVNILSFMVPAGTTPGPNEPTYSRWRFSNTDRILKPAQSPNQPAPNGEVEDHLVFIDTPEQDFRFDFGDAPDKPYPTLLASHGAQHRINKKVYLGRRVEGEADGQPSINSDGDDQVIGSNVDDEDGVRFLTPLVPGNLATVEVIASTRGWLNSWIDFDRNGNWDMGAPEQIFSAEPLTAGVNILTFMVPHTAKPGPNEPTYSRWRFSTTDPLLKPGQDPAASMPDGEVEDHLVFISERDQPDGRFDFGDAPDQPYPTLLASNGARHLINPKVYLGSKIDADPNGQPTINAKGDDIADGSDDEDGVHFVTGMNPGDFALVDVEASIDGFLDAWVDFNQDGTWDSTEQIATSAGLIPGVNTIDFFVPGDAFPMPSRPAYSRFRFSTHGGLAPHGMAKDGEVEDYAHLHGDVNADGSIGIVDIDLLGSQIRANDNLADLNGDGQVNGGDMDYLIHEVVGSTYGDANLDGRFDSKDVVQVFASGEYEDGIQGNSGWAEGDWNQDGDFTTADLVTAMQDGGYALGATAAVSNPQIVVESLSENRQNDRQTAGEDVSDKMDLMKLASTPNQVPDVQMIDSIFADDDHSTADDEDAELMHFLAEELSLV